MQEGQKGWQSRKRQAYLSTVKTLKSSVFLDASGHEGLREAQEGIRRVSVGPL